MVPIENEQNIEILRKYTLWLEAQVKELGTEVAKLKNAKEAEKQEWLNAKLRDQLSRLQKQVYARGREELTPREDRPVGHSNEQLNLHGEYPQEGKEKLKEGLKPKGPVFFTYKMSERQLAQESLLRKISAGAKAWVEVPGLYQQANEITVFERVYQEVLHRQCKYRLRSEYNDSDKEVLVTAPGPAKLRPGSKYSVDFGISVVTDKYEYHIPLERQRRKMEAQGLNVDTKTLYGLCEAVAAHCHSIGERIRQDIFKDFCAVHIDESPWPIQGQESQGYMWAISNRCGSYYQFEPTRSGKVATHMLRGYKGSALTDGYGGYNAVKKSKVVRIGHCWSHARREFFDRIADYPKEATEAVKMIDELFQIEAEASSFEQLRELRKSRSKPLTDKLYQWLIQVKTRFLPGEGVVSAANYCLKFWIELTRFLTDLSLPLSNNDAERALRHVVMGRKNFGGSKTIDGADTAASIYTVIESCKRVGLQPSQYLKYLIEERWFGEHVLTPLELSVEKLGPNQRVKFPDRSDWVI